MGEISVTSQHVTCVLGFVRGVDLREEIRRPVKQTVREGAYGLENATSATSPPPRGHALAPRSGGTSAELGRLPPHAVLASYCFRANTKSFRFEYLSRSPRGSLRERNWIHLPIETF